MVQDRRLHIVIVGSGAAGLAAAWLLAKKHRVTLLEKDDRLGGHAHTATVSGSDSQKIDTGFIVYNEPSYPNLTQWFKSMDVATEASDMSFAVSRDNGNFEYAGGPVFGLLAQRNLPLKPRFWKMLRDLLRFYREAPNMIPSNSEQSLGEFLAEHGYSEEFIQDHLLPFGAAIWSTSKIRILDYPAASFIRFCDNHGLLRISDRPQWRTVSGGSEQYVNAVNQSLDDDDGAVRCDFPVNRVERFPDRVVVHSRYGDSITADHVVMATHADQALACLDVPSTDETALLSNFEYESNLAILHTDIAVMPKRKRAWCSWNYVEHSGSDSSRVSLSYWMNKLQNIDSDTQYMVTLNPDTPPAAESILRSQVYQHPVFSAQTWKAQQSLWSLQGTNRTWFCGSYFGSGFHEDAVQAGFAVAEHLGGVKRPWTLDNPSARIVVPSENSTDFSKVCA
ncbi:FAD-dependent oxidoreductase [Granulosicoccus sp.]|nr:FAD-dependent oxidoreductase [Granulosicoccus sp.]MDB4224746.1 FAD-dependent oxidoreductase [Granulosicoccus sp.]